MEKITYLSTALDALVACVPGHVVELVLLEEVLGTGAVGLVQRVLALDQEERALERGAQHLVRVPRDRVRSTRVIIILITYLCEIVADVFSFNLLSLIIDSADLGFGIPAENYKAPRSKVGSQGES